MSLVAPQLMLVTEPRYGLGATRTVVRALAQDLGPRFVLQLRDRDAVWSHADKVALAAIAHDHAARVWVNRDVVLARDVHAEGIHADLTHSAFLLRSAPVHSEAERAAAIAAGANALIVSPVFEVPGKGEPCGLGFLQSVVRASPRCQVWALGGLDRGNAEECLSVGAVGVAMQRALYEAVDLVGLARAL